VETILKKLRRDLLARHAQSDLTPMSAAQVRRQWSKHPNAPADFLAFLRVVGKGSIGRMEFMIYGAPQEPAFIYGGAVGEKLKNVVLIGDDFAGRCVGYDTSNVWRLVEVGSNGKPVAVTRSIGIPKAVLEGRRPLTPNDVFRVSKKAATFSEMVRDRFIENFEEATADWD
jgi:hypothetical protein